MHFSLSTLLISFLECCNFSYSTDYPFGIRLVSTINDKVLATFCAGHPDDRQKFVADLRETILECAEMEEIRIGSEYN